MSFIKKLFGYNQVQCPRCLGKGFVNDADIRRLGKELIWRAGPCAYCSQKGKVSAQVAATIPADMSYLTTDLPTEERAMIMKNDSTALERANAADLNYQYGIRQMRYLYFGCKMTVAQIATFYLIPDLKAFTEAGIYEAKKKELVEYVERVVAKEDTDN